MSNTNLITSRYSLVTANGLIDAITLNPCYFFIGDHVPKANVANVVASYAADAYYPRRDMIAGKKIQPDDVSLMIRNVPYESGKVFDMWDDQDEDIDDKDFYCIVDDNAFYHVYKCLDNNMGANSTVQPDFSHIHGANTALYQTSDGYRWKYMFSVDEAIGEKFKSNSYFPIVANTEVQALAVAGAVDIIKIERAGKNYNNYVEGTFSSSDIAVNSNNSLFLVSNSVASGVNSFYTDCILYISSGDGVGEHRIITDYISNSNGNFIVLDRDLIDVSNGSRYQIYPRVVITGDGSETTSAVARALVNATASNAIYRVEMLDPGEGYKYISASVTANTVVGVTQTATLRPIYSPLRGHGYYAARELKTDVVCATVKFQNTESNTILWQFGFQQLGIIKEPLFANVNINTINVSSSFLIGEAIYKINPLQIGYATIDTASSNLILSNTSFNSYISNTDFLWITESTNTYSQFVAVNNVINSTAISLASNGTFSTNNAVVFLAKVSSNCIMKTQLDDYNFFVGSVAGNFSANDIIIGNTSGTVATVNTIIRNEVTKGFNTFMALQKYKGTLISGQFSNNEVIYQTHSDGSTSNASLCSIITGSGIELWVSNQVGAFDVGGTNTVVGYTSGAVAYITNSYSSELEFSSGEILYLENLALVQRANNQTETLQIYFEF